MQKYLLIFLLLAGSCFKGQTENLERSKEIILLNSYHPGFIWSSDITKAVQDYYKGDESMQLYIEFMDAKRFASNAHFEHLHQLYKNKYQNSTIDGIICSDNHALEFYLKYGIEIWGDIPVIYCGINLIDNFNTRIDTLNINGIEEKIDIASTIKLAKNINPQLKNLIVISDNTLSGHIFTNQYQKAIKKVFPQAHSIYFNSDSIEHINQTLSEYPATETAIYLLSLYSSRYGIPDEMISTAHQFLKNTTIPIYSNWDFLLDDLIIGGRIIKGYDQGNLAARMMDDKLMDRSLNQSTQQTVPHYWLFDFNKLRAFKINERTLPPDAIVLYRPIHWLEEYKLQLIIFLSVAIILLVINILLVSNIIKRKRIELELLESEKRLELAMEGAGEGLWDIHFKTNTIYFNDQFAQLLGYQNTHDLNLTTDNWTTLVFSDDIDQLKEAFQLHQTGKTPVFQCETRMIKKEGNLAWFAIHGKITESKDQIPMRLTGVMMDISAQKEFEQQLRIAKNKAEQSDRLKSSFLANMSHEIRTPMNAILGFTDILLAGDLSDAETAHYLDLIRNSGENLLNLINDIIDISKIESGELKIRNEKFNLHMLLDNTNHICQTLITNLNKDIRFTIIAPPAHKKLFIFSDPYRLQQILLNLLTNAIKFTDEGFVELKYAIIPGDLIRFSVKDTGPGIRPEQQKIIFERFRQLDEISIKKFGGTGLGLSITKSLVKLLGGEIRVESEPQKGAVFSFDIPNLDKPEKYLDLSLKHQDFKQPEK
ncbi:PAS domain-containing sensor histidine kinase [Marinilabiliaceae bacterium JC017]|nr:PAS domain-containing sensor histidine kinase [Marinilabiliaceae bacterium JC017]